MTERNANKKNSNANLWIVILMVVFAAVTLLAAKLLPRDDAPPADSPLPEISAPVKLTGLEALAAEDSRVNAVIENINDYPETFIELLLKNPDARDYVLNYSDRKDDTSVGSLTAEETAGGLPPLYQWDGRWGYTDYGSGKLGITGCGPTCLSILAVGLADRDDVTPADVAKFSEENNHYTAEGGTSWSLITAGAAHYGMNAVPVTLWEDSMVAELEAGHPIVANVGPGDFTDFGHYFIITGYENGAFTIHDPNSPTRSARLWDYETLQPQISNIWAFSKL